MDEQELDRMLPGWRVLSDAVGRELIAWREAHPRASLRQIEDAVFEAMQRLQAQALQQVVLASAVADVAAACAATDVPDLSWSSGAARPPAADDPTSPPTRAAGSRPQLRRVRRVWSRSFPPWMKNWSCCQAS
jgi:hypothetical protein